jgi:hypothetical protein
LAANEFNTLNPGTRTATEKALRSRKSIAVASFE